MSWRVQLLDLPEHLFRLGAAVLIGCLIGINREVHRKPTGVRTLGLVGLGSALAVLVVTDAFPDATGADVSRAIQGVITGIGFLGAGVILKDSSRSRVHGLTTAASIWVTACLGVACALGAWEAVFVSSGLMVALLAIGERLDKALHRRWSVEEAARPGGREDDSPS
ncbi:MAG TPA: MgtC/SapB family protein [Burkholderiales bacterium]|nr:MgtC/SapB family protein [Burkholderiales bacterium]